MRIRYQDDEVFQDGGHGYQATNESPETITKLLDRITTDDPSFKVEHVGSICSGGEVPILLMAPRYENVIAVDNSRMSLMWALLKAQLLRDFPVADVKKVLSTSPFDLSTPDMQKIGRRLVRRGLALTHANLGADLTGIWSKLTDAELTTAAQSLGNIQFVHGDMLLTWEKASKDVGGLDLIYCSNALTFNSPANVNDKGMGLGAWPIQRYADLLKPGGYVLATTDPNADTQSRSVYNSTTGRYDSVIPVPFKPPFDKIEYIVSGVRTTYTGGLCWAYWLCRKPLDGKPPTKTT